MSVELKPFSLVVSWNTGEEEGVRLEMRSNDFADLKEKAKEFLALIRDERSIYNDNVTKPLLAKSEELETAIMEKGRILRSLQAEIDEQTRLNGVSQHGDTEH